MKVEKYDNKEDTWKTIKTIMSETEPVKEENLLKSMDNRLMVVLDKKVLYINMQMIQRLFIHVC